MSQVLKVAHFSTSQSGGAAVAATRLSELLNSNGVLSHIYFRDNAQEFAMSEVRFLIRKLLGKFNTKLLQVVAKSKYGSMTPFSIGLLDVQKILKSEYNILHIHNWYNLFSIRDIRILARKFPIVFTLHDERLVTGGCHITLGCEQFRNSCRECPAIRVPHISLKKFKEQINVLFESKSRIALICPSEWLLKQVFNGLHTQNLRALRQISNVVQLSTVTRQEDTLEDHSGSVKLLFVAAELGSEVKGLQILLDALSQFHSQTGSNQTIDLTLIGNGKVDFDCLELVRISQIGFVAPSNVHQFMVNSDFLIVPSLSENSPNVVAEAQLLGLPVIASYVSGIPEMVEDSVSGFLFKKDSFDLISTLTRAMNFKDLGTLVSVARDRAEQRHDAKEIFSKHLSIYLDLIA